MDIEFVTKDNKTFHLSDLGMIATDFIVESIGIEEYSESIDGRHGKVDYGADYRDRTISVPFLFYPQELHEFSHGRDELFGALTDTSSYYIREKRRARRKQYAFVKPLSNEIAHLEPQHENEYVNGKQYLVRLSNIVVLDQDEYRSKGTLEFTTTELPFAETVYTTKQINDNGYDENLNIHGTADNINFDYTTYKFSTSSFSLWNAGNVAVQPESMYLKITFTGLNISSYMTIINNTTGERMTINKPMANKTIVIDGVKINDGVYNILRDTSRTFISLAPGLNGFSIVGATFQSVEFDFKFYYK